MMLPLLLCVLLQQPPLTQAEKDLLDAPFKEGLFDPSAEKAQRVRGTITLRTCYGKKNSMEASGWLVPAAGDHPARFVLNSLQEVASVENTIPVPFPNTTFDGFRYYGGPALPGVRKDRAVERVCDQAAYRLSGLIPDAPSYHPLLTDADTRLKELRIYIERNLGHFRRMTRAETAARELPWWGVHWVVGR